MITSIQADIAHTAAHDRLRRSVTAADRLLSATYPVEVAHTESGATLTARGLVITAEHDFGDVKVVVTPEGSDERLQRYVINGAPSEVLDALFVAIIACVA